MQKSLNNSSGDSSQSLPRPRREGTKRDLLIGFSYLILVLAALAYGSVYLCQWKTALDETPPLNCFNPVWSNQGDRLAFLQDQPEAASGQTSKCSLWTVDNHADSSSLIVKDIDTSYRILGWFDNDDTIVLHQSDSQTKQLTLLTIALSSRSLNKYAFSDTTVRLIGHSGNEVFLQRNLHNTKTNADEIELLTWSPQNPELSKIIAIPNRPSVEVSIDSANPNKDASSLAIVLRSVPKASALSDKAAPPALPPGAEASQQSPSAIPAEDEQSDGETAQYSVWVLDRLAKKLAYTNYSATEPHAVATAWSKDSSRLACVASFNGYADIALYQNGADLRTVRLRTYEQEKTLIPQMHSDSSEVYLISSERLLQYNFASNSSSILADSNSLKLQPTSISLAQSSNYLAVTSRLSSSEQLYISSVDSISPQRVSLDGNSAPPTTLYELASALQCAASSWKSLFAAQ